MRIVIVCAGSRGDVQPYAALARGGAAAGHDVHLVTHQEFRGLVAGHPMRFTALPGHPRRLIHHADAQRALTSGRNVLSLVRNLFRLWKTFMASSLEVCRGVCAGADVVVYSPLAFPAYHAAEAAGATPVGGFLQPLTRTGAFPAPGFPAPGPCRHWGWYNRATYALLEMQAWLLTRRDINRWRTRELGLPPLSWQGPYPRLYRGQIPILYGFSEAVVPRPPDWPSSFHVTGYWILPDDGEGYEAPAELRAFLDSGPPPVYVGFGSMVGRDPVALARTVRNALRRAGLRGLLQRGWGGMDLPDAGADMFVVDELPHSWLFPRVAAVVHHGGAGTTAAGLRAGRPTLAVPFLGDQFFWGARVAALGAGPPPIPARRLSVERLSKALHALTSSPEMRARAEAVGARLRAEDGVAVAIEKLEHIGAARARRA